MPNNKVMRLALEWSPVPLLVVDHEGQIRRVNRKLSNLFGYDAAALEGQPIELLVPQDVVQDHPSLRNAYFRNPEPRTLGGGRELHGRRQDGRLIPVEIGLEPLTVDEQEFVLVSVVDIQSRRDSEAVLRRALNAAATAMVQVDQAGKIELVNERACQLFGYLQEELLGQSVEMLLPVANQKDHAQHRAEYAKRPTQREMGVGRELFAVRKDGSEFPVEIGLTPIPGREALSTMATIIDITQRKTWQEQLEQKNRQLLAANNELLQFAYSVSHELKSPLRAIVGLLDLSVFDLQDREFARVELSIEKMRSVAGRLSSRIEKMLNLAKSNSEVVEWSELDFPLVFQQIWEVIDQGNVSLMVDWKHQRLIKTSPERLGIILENLLTNAVKYQRSEEPNPSVTVKTWEAQDSFCFSVADNGIGIPETEQENAFRLFHRISNGRSEGSGIGLALVKKNVSQLGGKVELKSQPGDTIFTVILPQS